MDSITESRVLRNSNRSAVPIQAEKLHVDGRPAFNRLN